MKKIAIIILIALGCYLIFDQVTSFIGKVNTTVGKANSSMERGQNNLEKYGNTDY